MLSIILPVYKNLETLPLLLERLAGLRGKLPIAYEAVFVVDGSPDGSYAYLRDHLKEMPFNSQLLLLSRNFGSFSAIRAGLEAAEGEQFAVMAADLQEPPELVIEMSRLLSEDKADIVLGTRASRGDPWSSRLFASVFWGLYRRFVQSDCPPGGVDMFACNRHFKSQLDRLRESNTTLMGLLLWMGFRRATVSYNRVPRPVGAGKSAWSFARKFRYLLDSFFAFSDIPIRAMSVLGVAGLSASLLLTTVVVVAKLSGEIEVPGYAATAVIVLFFGGLNSLGIGLIGEYLWRTFENTKARPPYIVATRSKPKQGAGS